MLQKLTNADAFKLTKPVIYTLITCLDDNGKPNAVGVSWVTRTSIKPALIMISIAFTRYSHDAIKNCGEFVVNYPNEEQAKGAWICGVESGRNQDKLEKAGLKLVPSEVVKVPTIDNVTAAFECKVISNFVTGDHTVFVGEVVAARGNPEKAGHLYVDGENNLVSIDKEMNMKRLTK